MATEFTRTEVSKARQAIAKASEMEQKIQNAKALGLQCDEQEQQCQQAKAFLLAWNELYGMQGKV